MPDIDTVIADHLKVLFWDMLHEKCNEFKDRDRAFNISIVFMAVIVKGYCPGFSIIFIDPLGGNDRAAEITANVLEKSLTSARVGLA